MTTTAHLPTTAAVTHSDVPTRILCAVAAAATVAPFTLASIPGDSGAEIARVLVEDFVPLTAAGAVAMVVSAVLFMAAIRVGDAVGGVAGRVIGVAGAAVALMYAAYYATFAAASVVATEVLAEPGSGLGEGASLLLNLTEITRYAPGLALVAAAVVARRLLAKGIWISAAVLAVLTIVPFTSWVAALLIPVWLLLSAAVTSPKTQARP